MCSMYIMVKVVNGVSIDCILFFEDDDDRETGMYKCVRLTGGLNCECGEKCCWICF